MHFGGYVDEKLNAASDYVYGRTHSTIQLSFDEYIHLIRAFRKVAYSSDTAAVDPETLEMEEIP